MNKKLFLRNYKHFDPNCINNKMNDIGSVYPLFIIFLTYSQGRHTDVNEHEQKLVPQVY